jgi:hypothetical protein
VIFTTIAGRALDFGIVYPAPMLYLQAAHAYLMAEQDEKSTQAANTGLELLVGQERRTRLESEGLRYIDALKFAGRKEEAELFRSWLNDRLQNPAPEVTEGDVPEKCPYCGASMSLEEIRAGRGSAAECQYCGSVVLARK